MTVWYSIEGGDMRSGSSGKGIGSNESFCGWEGIIGKVTVLYQNCQTMHTNQFCKTDNIL